MKAVASYSRVSTTRQSDEGMSLELQRRSIANYCAALGWPEPLVYEDAGVSAYKDDIAHRPAFARLLADAEAGALGTIVVASLDRWARKLRVIDDTLRRLDRAGVALISLREHLDYSTAVGKLTINMLGAIAQHTSDDRSESARRIHADLKSQGKLSSGRPPWGAIVGDDGRLAVNPATQDDLRKLLHYAAHWSDAKVADYLNERGIPPPGAGIVSPRTNPTHWWPRSVRAIVRNADWLLSQPPPWPALWLAAHHRPRRPPVGKLKIVRALSGLVRCGICGKAVAYGRTRGKEETRWLRCLNPAGQHHHGPAIPHEQAVVEAASRLILLPSPTPTAGFDGRAWAALQEERRRWSRIYARREIDEAEYDAEMAALSTRAAALAADGSPARDAGDIATLLPRLAGMDPPDINEVLRALIERVEVNRSERRIVWKPDTTVLFSGW